MFCLFKNNVFLEETAADIAKTQAIFQIIKMVAAKREAEKELESIHQERLNLEKHRHKSTFTPPSRPGSRNGTKTNTDKNNREQTINENDEESNTDHENNNHQIQHSFMIGYLPPEKEPPPFKSNFKKKIPKL